MIVKAITVYLRPGQRAAYLAAQEIWNKETQKSPGYLGCFVGATPDEPRVVHINAYWRTREDLDRFMVVDHDRIAALAQAHEHYERIEVRVMESVLPAVMAGAGANQ